MTSPQVSTVVEDPASVDAAIESRFCARAFLPKLVARDTIADILRVARRAPSGTNCQPWKVPGKMGLAVHRPAAGFMFTVDRVMGRGSLVDYGMFLQNMMVAARARGLHTCPQAAWNGFGRIILPHIGAGPDEMLVCGMSMGYADEKAKVNSFHTPRVPVEEFTHWLD